MANDLPAEAVEAATYTALRDAIAEAIPNDLFASPVVGIGGARRQKVADYAMRAVLPALAEARAQVLAEVDAALRDDGAFDPDGYWAWLQGNEYPEAGPGALAGVAQYLADTLGAGEDGEGDG